MRLAKLRAPRRESEGRERERAPKEKEEGVSRCDAVLFPSLEICQVTYSRWSSARRACCRAELGECNRSRDAERSAIVQNGEERCAHLQALLILSLDN